MRNEHLSAANTRDYVKVVGTKRDAETIPIISYIQFVNAVVIEFWDGSPVHIFILFLTRGLPLSER